jgi:hypothetical protein
MNQSHKAPACFKTGTRSPEICVAISRSNPPNKLPPINTAGNCTFPLPAIDSNSLTTLASSFSSTSYTAGLTPRPRSKRFTTWLMQHPRLPNTMTAFSDTKVRMFSVSFTECLGDDRLRELDVLLRVSESWLKWVFVWSGCHDL